MIKHLPMAAMAMNEGVQVLWDDGERMFCRRKRAGDGLDVNVLIASTAAEQPWRTTLDRLAHEYSFKDELQSPWAARPLELLRENGTVQLVLEDPGGVLLAELLSAPMQTETFCGWPSASP